MDIATLGLVIYRERLGNTTIYSCTSRSCWFISWQCWHQCQNIRSSGFILTPTGPPLEPIQQYNGDQSLLIDSEAEGLSCRWEKCMPSRLSISKLLSRTSSNSWAPYFHAPVSLPGCFRNETPIHNFMHMTKQLISTRGASDLPCEAPTMVPPGLLFYDFSFAPLKKMIGIWKLQNKMCRQIQFIQRCPLWLPSPTCKPAWKLQSPTLTVWTVWHSDEETLDKSPISPYNENPLPMVDKNNASTIET